MKVTHITMRVSGGASWDSVYDIENDVRDDDHWPDLYDTQTEIVGATLEDGRNFDLALDWRTSHPQLEAATGRDWDDLEEELSDKWQDAPERVPLTADPAPYAEEASIRISNARTALTDPAGVGIGHAADETQEEFAERCRDWALDQLDRALRILAPAE